MTEETKITRPRMQEIPNGSWAGWHLDTGPDPFEDLIGPLYCRLENGEMICGFRPDAKNCNGGGFIHGGALMAFADYALLVIAGGSAGGLHGVTLTMNCEFVGAAEAGRLLTARGEVVREGGSIVFVRGMIDDDGRQVMAWSATIKKRRPR